MAAKKTSASVLGDLVIPVSRLHLNLSNPRHEPATSETDAIQRLCDDELITELAKDITERGALSPLEVLGVMPAEGNPGHYIALEGNRRTCALLVLSHPERAPKEFQAQLRRLAAKANVPRELKVHVFADETQAKQWIELRHLGQQGGAGTKDWTPTQQVRAAGTNVRTSARANTLALLVLERLQKRGLLTKEQRGRVSLSTMTRYLGTPGVRAILGLGSPNELLYTHEPDEVDAALQRMALDSIEPQTNGKFLVHSRSDSTDRLTYAQGLKSSGAAPSSRPTTPTAPPKPTKVAASTSATKRSARSIDSRRHLFDRSFTVAVKDAFLLELRREALELPIEDYRFSANYLLRAIVERVMILFAKKKHRLQSGMDDQELTTACWRALKELGAPRGVLTTIEQATHKNQPHSLHSLGHAVHGGTIPTATDLRARVATWEPVLAEMLKHL